MAAIPGRLDWNTKRHFEQELLSFVAQEDGKYLITKDETKEIVKLFLKQSSSELFTELDHRLNLDIETLRKMIIEDIEKKFVEIEKHVQAYFSHKVDKMAEAIVERLTNRNFEAEVAKAVQKKLNNRGKF
jgi:hypothetical protein